MCNLPRSLCNSDWIGPDGDLEASRLPMASKRGLLSATAAQRGRAGGGSRFPVLLVILFLFLSPVIFFFSRGFRSAGLFVVSRFVSRSCNVGDLEILFNRKASSPMKIDAADTFLLPKDVSICQLHGCFILFSSYEIQLLISGVEKTRLVTINLCRCLGCFQLYRGNFRIVRRIQMWTLEVVGHSVLVNLRTPCGSWSLS